MTSLVLFDIDGTLTDTSAVDDECFFRAMGEVFGIECSGADWAGSPHATDSSIARWLCTTRCGRCPDDGELERLIARFVELLHQEARRAPWRFHPMPGAVGLLADLRAQGWHVALATGGWEASAKLKLAASGLAEPGLILASASDALAREDVLELAIDRASDAAGLEFGRVVSVGDGPWDARTAANLALPFLGVARDGRADALRAAGATTILADLRDHAAVHGAVEAATVPGGLRPRLASP